MSEKQIIGWERASDSNQKILKAVVQPITAMIGYTNQSDGSKTMHFHVHTGPSEYQSELEKARFGFVNGEESIVWIEHEIYHIVAARLLDSPFGKFLESNYQSQSYQTNGSAGEIVTAAIQNFFSNKPVSTFTFGEGEEKTKYSNLRLNANVILAGIHINYWLKNSVSN